MEQPAYANFVADTYKRFPVTFVRGSGTRLWDDQGREYIDFTSGIAVCSLGHCHPKVTDAIQKQAETLVHTSNLYWIEQQARLAERLARRSFADQAFFCNSGAESVEAAIKLARKRGHELRGPNCYDIVCLEGSFHGRTLAAITATGQPQYQHGFEPLVPGFTHIAPNDVYAAQLAIGQRTAAVIVEPILGEGGVRPLDDEFLLAIRRLCDEHDAILIFDEVQVGMGRIGSLFAYEQTPVVPDVLCLAKALGNGVPIGAMLARKEVMCHFTPGSHASTFGGNPLSCAAANAVLDVMSAPGFFDHVKEMAAVLRRGLEELAAVKAGKIVDIRGRGLIQALEFAEPVPDLGLKLLEKGLLVLLGQEKIVRLLPPLIISQEEIESFLETLDKLA